MMCISFLQLPEEMITNLVAYDNQVTQLSHSLWVRSLGQLGGCHKAEIKLGPNRTLSWAHSRGWQDPVPCSCRAEVPVSLPTVTQEPLSFQGHCLPYHIGPSILQTCSNGCLFHASHPLPRLPCLPLPRGLSDSSQRKFSALKGSCDWIGLTRPSR